MKNGDGRISLLQTIAEGGRGKALVLSGGYGPLSWQAHARSLEGILARFDR